MTEAIEQHRHRGISDPDQAWILGELIAYLDSLGYDQRGCSCSARGTLKNQDQLVAPSTTRRTASRARRCQLPSCQRKDVGDADRCSQEPRRAPVAARQ